MTDREATGTYIGVAGLTLILLGMALGGCGGCASVRKGDFEMVAWGLDPTARGLAWEKTTTNGYECIYIDRGAVNASKSVGSLAAMIGGIAGAALGAPAGPGGAAAGAAGGYGLGKLWDKMRGKK
jgi:hypothetical protein